MPFPIHSSQRALKALVVGLVALACHKPAPQAPPPTEVAVLQVVPKPVSELVEFMGSVEASRNVEVRSQVTGVIMDKPYVEGSLVQSGDVLFRIDTTQYAATYRSAQARLSDAQARAANAERNVNRLRPLLADNAVARRDVDDAEAELLRARAAVEDAHGALDHAKKDYDDTTVRAQLTGRAGRANFVTGSRVTGPNDLLTTIDAIDPVYVTFRPSAQQVLDWQRDGHTARAVAPGGVARVQLSLADGSILPQTGHIDYVDPAVDPRTGTQGYRATFANPNRTLAPGQFVRVKLLGLTREDAIAIPQRAIQQALGRQFVYLAAPGDSVISRDITTGELIEGQVVVEQGLHAGDRVIVDGIQKVGPGRRVHPVPLAADPAASAGAKP